MRLCVWYLHLLASVQEGPREGPRPLQSASWGGLFMALQQQIGRLEVGVRLWGSELRIQVV